MEDMILKTIIKDIKLKKYIKNKKMVILIQFTADCAKNIITAWNF
jgi:hypothetical protein